MPKLFICGDIVNFYNTGNICSDELSRIIQDADYAICNFEAPIAGYGKPQIKSGIHISQQISTVASLKDLGFHLFLLANNHIMDYGKTGLNATIDLIVNNNLDFLGAGNDFDSAYAPLIKVISGTRIGMLNACESQFGVLDYFGETSNAGYAWINHNLIDHNILNLKKICDFVVVFSHAGLEHFHVPQKEWRARYQHFCKLGADIVIGSHPHVPQGYEKYGNSLIFYSLGNFYFDILKYKNQKDHSFSVILDLTAGCSPDFDFVFHYKKENKVFLANENEQTNIKSLCDCLSHEYIKHCENISITSYNKFIKRELANSLLPQFIDATPLRTLRTIIATLLGRRNHQDKMLLLLHLLRNESYFYAAVHALEVLARNKYQHESDL